MLLAKPENRITESFNISRSALTRKLTTLVRFNRFAKRFAVGLSSLQARHALGKIDTSKHINHDHTVSAWMDHLINDLNLTLKVRGRPLDQPHLSVANHISWVDALVLASIHPYSFIAKNEVRTWPFIGKISGHFQTQFIERRSKFSVYRSLPNLEKALVEKKSVLFFPEGTTTNGLTTLPFYPMLFEAAVRTRCPIQPVSLRYADTQGKHLPIVGFIDDDTLIDTLHRMFLHNEIQVKVHFHDPIEAPINCRKNAAIKARKVINASLKSHSR